MPALAQTPGPEPSSGRVGTTDTNRDHDFNYGWLGLLGLAGLIPRGRRNHDTDTGRTR
jgi:hypothetical protein